VVDPPREYLLGGCLLKMKIWKRFGITALS
jgi:hypothetical protein